jgi:hypothetical protein
MHDQMGGDESDVIPFARDTRVSAPNADQLDKAGQTILQLLHKAAEVAEENSRHALDTAQKLSEQLRDAEDRIAEVEAEITAQRDRADREQRQRPNLLEIAAMRARWKEERPIVCASDSVFLVLGEEFTKNAQPSVARSAEASLSPAEALTDVLA